MKEINEYINEVLTSQFQCYRHPCSFPDAGKSSDRALIFGAISRSKFRRTKLDQESKCDIENKIDAAIKLSKPIEFSVPFGAYKNWRLPSYPNPDWAEVFNLHYMIDFLSLLTEIYPPGAVLNYTYTSGVLDRVSNLPIAAQSQYLRGMRELVTYFDRIHPSIRFRLVDIRDQYGDTSLEAELEENFEYNRKNWSTKYSIDVQHKKLMSAESNLVLNGVQDLTGLRETELAERVLESAMWCDALDSLRLRRKFNKYGSCIQLVFIKGPDRSMHIGSCRASCVQFVVGIGILQWSKGELLETIASPRVLHELRSNGELSTFGTQNLSPIPIESLDHIWVSRK